MLIKSCHVLTPSFFSFVFFYVEQCLNYIVVNIFLVMNHIYIMSSILFASIWKIKEYLSFLSNVLFSDIIMFLSKQNVNVLYLLIYLLTIERVSMQLHPPTIY